MADIVLAADGTPGPVSRSYWIVEGRLAAGAYPDPRPDCDRIGPLLAVNLGDDADTTGAIYGQIAGAHYGVRSIPESWRHKLSMRKEIEALADRLLASA